MRRTCSMYVTIRNLYRVLIWEREERDKLVYLEADGDNIKIKLNGIGCEDMN
jgi:hypothetical protein